MNWKFSVFPIPFIMHERNATVSLQTMLLLFCPKFFVCWHKSHIELVFLTTTMKIRSNKYVINIQFVLLDLL